jgi:hypothetical protein
MLPDNLIIEDKPYQLIRNHNRWFLYAGPSMMPGWGAYVIIKADIEACHNNYAYPGRPVEGENVCTIKCGNATSVKMKYNELTTGTSNTMRWKPGNRKPNNDLELMAYSRLTIQQAFAALEGSR